MVTMDQSSSPLASRRSWNMLQGSLIAWRIIFWKGCIPPPSLILPQGMQIQSTSTRMKVWKLRMWLQSLEMELLPSQTSLNLVQQMTGIPRSRSSNLQLGQKTSPRLVFSTAPMELQFLTCFLLAFPSHCVFSVSTTKNVPSLTRHAN